MLWVHKTLWEIWLNSKIFTLKIFRLYSIAISFLHKMIVHNMLWLCFQTKDSDMHVHVDSWDSHDGDENQQNNKFFQASFFYTFLYWVINQFITSIGKFFRQVKKTNKTTTLKSPFLLLKIFILINKVTHGYNFSLLASFSSWKISHK